jgi:hypothetical protein
MLVKPGGLADAFGQVLSEIADVAAGFFAAAQDSFGVNLLSEPDDMRGFG